MYQTKQTCPSKVIFCNTEDKHLRYTDFSQIPTLSSSSTPPPSPTSIFSTISTTNTTIRITTQLFRDKALRFQFLAWLRSFLLLLSILRLCLLCATCHLSSETWYNLSQSTNSEKKKIDIDVRIMETQFVNIFTKIWAISEHWSSETVSLPFQAKGERDPAWFWIQSQTCC